MLRLRADSQQTQTQIQKHIQQAVKLCSKTQNGSTKITKLKHNQILLYEATTYTDV